MFLKKIAAFLLAVCVAVNGAAPVFANSKLLTLPNAIRFAQANFPDTRTKKNELASKRLELIDAIEEIKQARRKQRSIKFSLLFNLQFPEKTTLNKEYDLISKTPSIEAAIRTINRELQDLQLEAANQAVQKYSDAYCLEQRLAFDEARLEQAEKDYNKTRLRTLSGQGAAEDLEALSQQVEALTATVSTGRLKVKNARSTLGRLLNMNLNGYTLQNPLVTGTLARDRLENAAKHGLEKSLELFVADSDMNYTSYCVRLLDDLYTQKWGSKINMVRPYMYGSNVDTPRLLTVYENMRRQLDAPWDGEYKIWLIFFTLRIPKDWFKGSRDGLRYFSDGQYPLVEAVLDREGAIEVQRQTKSRLHQEILDTYEIMQQAYRAYTTAVTAAAQNKTAYEQIAALNKSGLASQIEVRAAKDNYEESQINEMQVLMDYNTVINLFNRKTGGYLTDVIAGKTTFEAVGAGVSYAGNEAAQSGKYYFNTLVSGFSDSLKIVLPSGFSATDFEIWHGSRWRVGARTPVNKEIAHIHSAFQGEEEALIYFFNDGKLIAKAVIDTGKQTGAYTLQPQSQPQEPPAGARVLGSFKVSRTDFDIISDISVLPDLYLGVTSYNISDMQGVMLLESEPIPIAQDFTYISVGTLPLNELTVHLYDASGQLLTKAAMDEKSGQLLEMDGDGN